MNFFAVIFFVGLTLGVSGIATAQNMAYVKLTPTASPTGSPAWQANNPSLATLLDDVGATLVLAHPSALTTALKSWYYLSCSSCDVEDLLQAIVSNNYPNVLDSAIDGRSEVATCGDCPQTTLYNDPLHDIAHGTSYQVEAIGADCIEAFHDDGERITIAVIDTEFDVDHPDLIGRLSEVNIDHLLLDPATKSASHGTAVASMIIANQNNGIGMRGNCSTCDVVGYTIGQGRISENIDIRNGALAALADGHRIVNISWSGVGGGALADNFYAEFAARGAFLAIAAGNNSGVNPRLQTPGSDSNPGIFVVTSTQPTPGYAPLNTPYQMAVDDDVSSGIYVDLMAPGYRVTVAEDPRFGRGLYSLGWGTSLSSPLVAGIIGSMLSVSPCLSPTDVEFILENTACTDVEGYAPLKYGAGIVDQAASVSAAREYANNSEHVSGASPIIIDEPTFWDGEFKSFNRRIEIVNGGSLTVTGSRLNFSITSGITVHSGGSLNGFASTFTYNRCGEYLHWDGITMNGSASVQNPNLSRPWVNLLSCEVNHANTGVADHGFPQPNATRGGDVSVKFTNFLNCRTGVSLYRPNGVDPQIIASEFIFDEEFPYEDAEPRGISIADSDPGTVTQVLGNSFVDTRSDRTLGSTGLSVINASFTINEASSPSGSPLGETRFSGLKYGVKAWEGLIANHTAEIRVAESVETHVSTWLVGYENPLVIDNRFEAKSEVIYNDRFGAPIDIQGIRMENCRRYEVEGNIITGDLIGPSRTFGIIIIGDETSTTRDAVYRNRLNACNYGMWSRGNNGGGANNLFGLCYECNRFNNCESDIESSPGATIVNWQIGMENAGTAEAGNVFGSTLMQFASRGNVVSYFRVFPSQTPDPRINVQPVPIFVMNSCLPLLGFDEPNPPCEELDRVSLQEDQSDLVNYFVDGAGSEEEALVALEEHNRRFASLVRRVVNGPVDGCDSNPVEEDWEASIHTGTPWEKLDESVLAVYQGDFVSARTAIEGLSNLSGDDEIGRLVAMLEFQQDLYEAETLENVGQILQEANALSHLSASELDQSYAQAKWRVTAASHGLADFEPLLSTPMLEDRRAKDDGLQEGVDIFALRPLKLYDVLGREVLDLQQYETLNPERLRTLLRNQQVGIYYLQGVDVKGAIHTISIAHAK